MKLIKVAIKNFRSFAGEHSFELSSGLNYLVGPNNAGKSNVLRAIELALDPGAEYDPKKDRPSRDSASGGMPVKTRLVLTFSVGTSGPERTLLRYADVYERKVRETRGTRSRGESPTYAGDRFVYLVTEFGAAGTRVTTFQAKGMGARSLSLTSKEHKDLEKQLRSVLRLAVIHSGEDLSSLLAGKFRDILNNVITEHLRDAVATAEASRETYLTALQHELLEPLRAEVQRRVTAVFSEISDVQLVPSLPSVQETLASVDVELVDGLSSSLADKGTGVRGAVLVAMLQYLAAQSRRSLVLAVEEPEAFLHPAAQESIRAELEALASQSGITLLVTTHSPYVVSRTSTSSVTPISKGADGVSKIGVTTKGSDALGPTLGSLYREAFLSDVLERSLAIPSEAQVVVITEGYTDWEFVSMCCVAAGRAELLDGVHVIVADKAKNVVPQAIIAHAATNLPVIALLDYDANGKEASKKLESFGWNKAKGILSLDKWPDKPCRSGHDVEIEDLLPRPAIDALITELGESSAISGKSRCGGTSFWHLQLSDDWKQAAVGDLRDTSDPKPARMPGYLNDSSNPAGGMLWLAEEVHRRAESLRRQGSNSARGDRGAAD
jgi:putative ATP-dependent endonuclease of OLD family